MKAPPLFTPDGRYLVVRGRLWRRTDPRLPEERRAELTSQLMAARRAVREALVVKNSEALRSARAAVNAAKHGLGERGPVWWDDGVPDLTRKLARNTPYADWFAVAEAAEPGASR